MEEDGYYKTVPIILISMDVLESGELKKIKINREDDFLNYSINYMNHCGTCNSYYKIVVQYNKSQTCSRC